MRHGSLCSFKRFVHFTKAKEKQQWCFLKMTTSPQSRHRYRRWQKQIKRFGLVHSNLISQRSYGSYESSATSSKESAFCNNLRWTNLKRTASTEATWKMQKPPESHQKRQLLSKWKLLDSGRLVLRFLLCSRQLLCATIHFFNVPSVMF